MSIAFAIFTFINAFCIMAFIAIPFSTKYAEESEESKPAIEGYAAAPKTVHWKKAIIIAVTLALFVTLALALIINSGIIPVRG
jgi:predicted secreted protein